MQRLMTLSLISLLLYGCGTATVFGDNGKDVFLDDGSYLSFAPCSYTHIEPEIKSQDTAVIDRWESCTGPHSPSRLGHLVFTRAKTLDEVIGQMAVIGGNANAKRGDEHSGGYKDSMKLTAVNVTYTLPADGRDLGFSRFAVSADGKHGFMCYVDPNKYEPVGPQTKISARMKCEEAIRDMAHRLHKWGQAK